MFTTLQFLKALLFGTYFHMYADDNGGGGGAEDDGSEFTPDEDGEAEKLAKAKAETAAAEKAEAEEKAALELAEKEKKEKDDEGKTDEEKAAEAEAAAKEEKEKKKDTRIPLARHKEMLEKERLARVELERKVELLQGGKVVAETNKQIREAEAEIAALDEKYGKHLADGEVKEAQAVMREIRALDREISERKSDMKSQAATALAVETVRYETTLARVEESYPQLNPDHEDFDKAVETEVTELMQAFQAKGLPDSQALQKAVKYVLGAETSKQKTATEVKAKVDADDVAKAEKEAQRKADAVKKGIETEKKQPPSTARVGMDSDKAGGNAVDAKAVMKMSQDDFSKLDEKELAKLRGDEMEA